MAYKIIQPPFTLKFQEMSRAELKGYFQWFLNLIPERIQELAKAVNETPGFESWQPDYTPTSLELLGQWLAPQIEKRERTKEEIQEAKNRSPYPMDIPETELTNRTFSLAIDAGMYLSQVFLQNHPSLCWNQEFANKKYVDYGQPVLVEFGPSPFNPTRMMVTLAYGLVDKTYDGHRLCEIYDIWSKQVRHDA